jgi:hypothetical protein
VRRQFDPAKLDQLAQSMNNVGQLQLENFKTCLGVRPPGKPGWIRRL